MRQGRDSLPCHSAFQKSIAPPLLHEVSNVLVCCVCDDQSDVSQATRPPSVLPVSPVLRRLDSMQNVIPWSQHIHHQGKVELAKPTCLNPYPEPLRDR